MKKYAIKFFQSMLLLAAMVCAQAVNCCADEILFLNGDRLTGHVTNIQNETVTFDPDLMGIITFAISKIESITMDKPVRINFVDGTSITTQKITFEVDQVLITGVHTGAVLDVPPTEIFSARDAEAGQAAHWKGSISGGVTKTDNDEDTKTFSAILQLQRRTPKHRLRTRGIVFVEREKTTVEKKDGSGTRRKYDNTEENYTGDTRYDYFFAKKWFWANGLNYKRDQVNDLDQRFILGSGLGHQWIDTSTNSLDTITGFAYINEQYTDEDNSYLSYLFGLNLDLKIWDKVTANLDAYITPKIDDPSDYIARGFGGIKLQATKSFFVDFNTIFEYNSKVERSDSTDTKFLLGFGWDFL